MGGQFKEWGEEEAIDRQGYVRIKFRGMGRVRGEERAKGVIEAVTGTGEREAVT